MRRKMNSKKYSENQYYYLIFQKLGLFGLVQQKIKVALP